MLAIWLFPLITCVGWINLDWGGLFGVGVAVERVRCSGGDDGMRGKWVCDDEGAEVTGVWEGVLL